MSEYGPMEKRDGYPNTNVVTGAECREYVAMKSQLAKQAEVISVMREALDDISTRMGRDPSEDGIYFDRLSRIETARQALAKAEELLK